MENNLYVATFHLKDDPGQETIWPPILVNGNGNIEPIPLAILDAMKSYPNYVTDSGTRKPNMCLKSIYGVHLPSRVHFTDEENLKLRDYFLSIAGKKPPAKP